MADNNEVPTEQQHLAEQEAPVEENPPVAEVDEVVAATEEPESDEEGVTERYTIDKKLFEGLLGMGFSENAIKKSIACGCVNEDTCVQWITMQADHPDLNTPLESHIRVKVKEKRVLTDEERVAKVEELKLKIQQNKVAEAKAERENALKAEKVRIEMGKAAAEMKEQLDEQKRKRAQEERRREKEADAAAREKIQLDLAVDRLVRQGKTPEEARALAVQQLAEKKKKIEEERRLAAEEHLKEQQQSATDSTKQGGAVWDLGSVLGQEQVAANNAFHSGESVPTAAPASDVDEFNLGDLQPGTESAIKSTFTKMQLHPANVAAPARFNAAKQTLNTILSGIVDHPLDAKKRTLRLNNDSIRARLGTVPHATQFLLACGFVVAQTGTEKHVTLTTVILRRLRSAANLCQP